MTYIISGYGTGGLGSDAKMALLKDAKAVAAGTMTLAQAQANWDARARPIRTTYTNILIGQQANLTSTRRLTPSQIAVEVEKKVVAEIGPRPKGTIRATNMTSVVQKSPAAEIIFGGQGAEVSSGIKPLHIVGGIALVGLIALAVKGT